MPLRLIWPWVVQPILFSIRLRLREGWDWLWSQRYQPWGHLISLKIAPSSVYTIMMCTKAGDVQLISWLKKGIKGDRIAVTGKTLKENVAGAEIKNEEIIHPIEHPISTVGGLSILYGSIYQDGAVIKGRWTSIRLWPLSAVRLFVAIHKIKPLSWLTME